MVRCCLVLVVVLACRFPANAWIASTTGPLCDSDQVNAVAVDAHGDVITAGAIVRTSDPDFAVVKFDGASGAELWRQVIDGPGHYFDRALAVTVDDAGDVIAAGQVYDVGYDILVVKLAAADGSIVWQRQISNVLGYDEPRAVTTDRSGDVVVLGSVDAQDNTEHPEMFVAALRRADGIQQWRNVAAMSFHPWGSVATAAVVDASGALYVGGWTDGFSNPSSGVAKLDDTQGEVVWGHRLGDGYFFALAALAQGDAVAVYGGAVVRLQASDGSEVWRLAANTVLSALAVDLHDDVLVASAGRVRKLNGSNGQPMWDQDAPQGALHQLIAADAGGNVLLAADSPSGEILKRDGASGGLLWSSTDQPRPLALQAAALAADGSGDAIVAGTDPLTQAGYAVAKLSGMDGSAVTDVVCGGDCNADGMVTIDELVRGVDIALNQFPGCNCPVFDANRDGAVTVDELIRAVTAALTGCAG